MTRATSAAALLIFGAALAVASAGSGMAQPVAAAAPKGDVELGRHLASECTACHQLSGRVTGNIPAIIALPEEQFVALMQAYRGRQRDHVAMQAIAGKLADEDVAALAAYFGAQKPR